MQTRTLTAYVAVNGKKLVYESREMWCQDHPKQSWQTEAQLQSDLDAIKRAKAASQRLAKHAI